MRRLLKLIALTLALPAAALAAYCTIAFALVFYPYPGDEPTADEQITAYVASNGIHAEFVLPVASPIMDWRTLFPLHRFSAPPPHPAFVAIGWGEREFYLNTPTWADLSVRRALEALFGRNSAVLHATYLDSIDVYPEGYRLNLGGPAYARLVEYIQRTLAMFEGQTIPIPGRGYGGNDAFFAANGSYDFLATCNSWVGRGLRHAGVKSSRWTPFDWTVTWHLRVDRE